MGIEKRPFGSLPDGRVADLYTLKSGDVEADITNYGGIITSLRVLDGKGECGDIVHGFETLEGYLGSQPYFGCIVGRYANRISGAKFTIDGKEYKVARNSGENSLHGGLKGFDKVLWDAEAKGESLKLSYLSRDGEEGYPGNLKTAVTYTLHGEELTIDYEATTDKPTILNLTNHTYFNLSCGGDILGHELTLEADSFTPTRAGLIPTGEIRRVAGTPLDFRHPTKIGARIETRDEQIQIAGGGYDANFVVNGEAGKLRRAATVRDPSSGRAIVVLTTQPGIQLYTSNFLDGSLRGKGRVYTKWSALCLETQHFPDSPNRPEFPSTVLRPKEKYHEKTVFRFHAG
jgi:aldose 1-epimerase